MSAKPLPGQTLQKATCAACGLEFFRFPAWLKKAKLPTCSQRCNGILRGREWAKHGHRGPLTRTLESYERAALRGPRNPAWKGGVTYRKRHGNYVSVRYVRCPPEFASMARKDGYVMEHRLVMAKRIGRPLLRVECVHHEDHQPLNNDPSNLKLWPDNRSHKMAEHGRIAEGAANRLSLTASAQL